MSRDKKQCGFRREADSRQETPLCWQGYYILLSTVVKEDMLTIRKISVIGSTSSSVSDATPPIISAATDGPLAATATNEGIDKVRSGAALAS